ncbi:MAG: tautomerase family protein [Bacteroidetes bacterium]|nr:tautomerase family protein [Bacteroidota bacterium]MCL5025161.1 tautomerase family protein [Chloroflexota bacterium]
MPIIRVELWEGRSNEDKASLIKALTDATVGVIGCPEGAVQVVIYDVPKASWGIGGENCVNRPSSGQR